ncbi:hypothetical protein GLAREA_02614 [Glarea lozoyensis ATCC 20868]|uniref:Uncharacterized protein n=1 Tax=Glarea lozoyensis (strain ATCC 20868 / MF5171) TaxID=1116229 RepID=S3D3R7_GLAL2|nr:uncharacterized protein GLAREA_02614 [Glarea lozoyensis ATCC 20868]EPE26701.1 hypothetical protein GLAREA_02614 [Glarea lozoyensis ATCC 20868]
MGSSARASPLIYGDRSMFSNDKHRYDRNYYGSNFKQIEHENRSHRFFCWRWGGSQHPKKRRNYGTAAVVAAAGSGGC